MLPFLNRIPTQLISFKNKIQINKSFICWIDYKRQKNLDILFTDLGKFLKVSLYFLQISKIQSDVWHFTCEKKEKQRYNGIFLPKLFGPTVRKNCSSDREKLLKFEAEGREFEKILRSLEQFIQTVKGQNNLW